MFSLENVDEVKGLGDLTCFGQFACNGWQDLSFLVFLLKSADEVKDLSGLARFGQLTCNGC